VPGYVPIDPGGTEMAEGRPNSIQEFKAFILRGNVLDLAVAVVIGAAFGAVVNAFVKDIITRSSPPSSASPTSAR
jgi:hypothetical protein